MNHQYPFWKFVAIIAVITATSGCATLFSSENQAVSMATTPPGAQITINGADYGQTPASIMLGKKQSYTVVFAKAGFEPVTCRINTSASAKWIILDVLGGLVPVIVDAATGAWNEFDRDACSATMAPAGEHNL